MAMPLEPYQLVLVESYEPESTAGLHGKVHIRPIPGNGFDGVHVQCSKALSNDYPPGTRFRLKAKLTDRKGGGQFLYSYHGWHVDVLDTNP